MLAANVLVPRGWSGSLRPSRVLCAASLCEGLEAAARQPVELAEDVTLLLLHLSENRKTLLNEQKKWLIGYVYMCTNKVIIFNDQSKDLGARLHNTAKNRKVLMHFRH